LDRRSHDRPRPGRPLHLAHISRRQRIETHKGRNAQRPRLNNEDHEANNTRSAKIDRSWPAATRRQETLKAESRPFLVTASNRYLCRLSSHLLNIATASSLDKATFFLPVSSLVTWSILAFFRTEHVKVRAVHCAYVVQFRAYEESRRCSSTTPRRA
jgi:hypothetical protein